MVLSSSKKIGRERSSQNWAGNFEERYFQNLVAERLYFGFYKLIQVAVQHSLNP